MKQKWNYTFRSRLDMSFLFFRFSFRFRFQVKLKIDIATPGAAVATKQQTSKPLKLALDRWSTTHTHPLYTTTANSSRSGCSLQVTCSSSRPPNSVERVG